MKLHGKGDMKVRCRASMTGPVGAIVLTSQIWTMRSPGLIPDCRAALDHACGYPGTGASSCASEHWSIWGSDQFRKEG